MIWFDVTKEPLPKGQDVLAQVEYCINSRTKELRKKFAVLYYHDCGEYSHMSGEFDYDVLVIRPNGEFSDGGVKVTHWAYIDPTGIEDNKGD
jgi:hypothetical protein